ncbi:MAG TPA: hypothetical protein VHB49_19360 [Bradyrhizobium sp.]|nr:hypothetical protein [Bradyrhizobium sp.]
MIDKSTTAEASPPVCPACKNEMKAEGGIYRCRLCRQFIIFLRSPDTAPVFGEAGCFDGVIKASQ